MTPSRLLAIVGLLAVAAWPLLVHDVFLQRVGALVLLAAISASAWNLLGGYAGQVSVGHAVYFGVGAYAGLIVYTEWGWPPIAGAPIGVAVSAVLAVVVGHADIPAARALFLHGDDRRGGAGAHPGSQLDADRRRGRADGAADAAHVHGPLVHQSGAISLSVPGGAAGAAGPHLADAAQPHGLLPCGDPRRRPRGTQPGRASAALQTLRAAAVGGVHLDRRHRCMR